ncbi:hypothetical protein IDSA_01135 [Pseudidiomarina salinarum]|uniref:N-acetyltransferase domain-containing protein n=1 Tax=Pseudidiomarina salinarum TaxID=435908 RepID=A0A094IUM5_9GAMM|nr:hypothetical protein [Pseudidiomarina salinarum]KFZ31360.1 hypothetical protein IDSA_01135 [Pseudidiomarina salinarum]RUO70881.1 hypothetical protein CWI79_05430 [Pseudidiomarina salinarum]
MSFTVRQASRADAEGVVALFSEDGNPHNWDIGKWERYYIDYTEGNVVAFIVESESKIIGHYGLFPVRIGKHAVYMGAHAHVSSSHRGLAVISALMSALDKFCIDNNIPFIVGFANPNFTIVKTKLFKWTTPFFASFVRKSELSLSDFVDRPLRFNYSAAWLKWRFGEDTAPVVSKYQKQNDSTVYQLLFTTDDFKAANYGLPEVECWSPDGYLEETGEEFAQPFSIKIYDKRWRGADLMDPDNWYIQMGDSDTFIYKALKA